MYLTYEEYLASGGSLAEADFAAAEFRARKRIDALTDGRVAAMAARGGVDFTPPLAVKQAMLAVIRVDGVAGAEAQALAPVVAAFNTDGYSESYGDPLDRTAALEGRLNAELSRLLYGVKDDLGVPLLYRGVN